MKELLSDEKVKQTFFELELKPQVFDYRIRNISLYFLLRFKLEQLYRFYNSTTQPSGIKKFIATGKRQIKSLFFPIKFPTDDNKTTKEAEQYVESKLLFVSTSDWIINDGESAEQVDLIKYYKSRGIPINFVQPDYKKRIIKKQPYHDGFLSLSLYDYRKLDRNEKRVIRDFLAYISKQWNINLNHELEVCAWLISIWISTADRLAAIIHKTKARYIFARSVYTEPWVLIACNISNTNCIEVQHGVTGPHHIYYQSALTPNDAKNKILFPDFVLTLGNEWTKIIVEQKSIFSPDNTFTLGTNEFRDYKPPVKSPVFNVLICLQHGLFSIDDLLSSFFGKYFNWLKQNNVTIIIRPHPNAFETAVRTYDEFLCENITISDSRKIKFTEDLKFANILLSPASMCLYEAIALKIPTASFTQFRGVTISGGLQYLTSEENLFEFIGNVKNKGYQQPWLPYLAPFNTSILDHFVNNDSNH